MCSWLSSGGVLPPRVRGRGNPRAQRHNVGRAYHQRAGRPRASRAVPRGVAQGPTRFGGPYLFGCGCIVARQVSACKSETRDGLSDNLKTNRWTRCRMQSGTGNGKKAKVCLGFVISFFEPFAFIFFCGRSNLNFFALNLASRNR